MRSPYDQTDGQRRWRAEDQDLDLPRQAERDWLQGPEREGRGTAEAWRRGADRG